MLSVGIIGLPNVGKSTLFNALTRGHANVSNYPFTTIDSNVGVVPVPDPRLERLAEILEPEEATPCFIELIDIAGLVEGASRGEGLGNQFLGEIRQVDAIAEVLRCFGGTSVAHVFGEIDPLRDAGVIETELLLADLEVLGRAVEKRSKTWKANPRQHAEERERLENYRACLEEGKPLRRLDLDRAARGELQALGLLSGLPMFYVANIAEDEAGASEPERVAELSRSTQLAAGNGAPEVVPISAEIEWELQQLEPEERAEFMTELGIAETGLERLVDRSFSLLGLIRFYTVAHGKLRAWEIERGERAPQAAGKVHSDMEEGFIRAQVVSYDELVESGSLQELHRHGRVRTEGKSYEVQDGDVIEFLFAG